jgi:hypothetical protein
LVGQEGTFRAKKGGGAPTNEGAREACAAPLHLSRTRRLSSAAAAPREPPRVQPPPLLPPHTATRVAAAAMENKAVVTACAASFVAGVAVGWSLRGWMRNVLKRLEKGL